MPEQAPPRHVAIIADGNRRWARERGLPVLAGHVQGIEAIRPVVRHARDRRVEQRSSVDAFSTENSARADDEVSGLFGLIDGAVRQYTEELVTERVRVPVIGRFPGAPSDVQRSIRAAEDRTAGGTGLTLNICSTTRAMPTSMPRELMAAERGSEAARRAAFCRPPVHDRPAGRGSRHPDRRRPARRRLPPVAGRVRGADLLRQVLADFTADDLDAALAGAAARTPGSGAEGCYARGSSPPCCSGR